MDHDEKAALRLYDWNIRVSAAMREDIGRLERIDMKPCMQAQYVSLINLCDSAAIVLTTRELFPDPYTFCECRQPRLRDLDPHILEVVLPPPETRIRSWSSATGIEPH